MRKQPFGRDIEKKTRVFGFEASERGLDTHLYTYVYAYVFAFSLRVLSGLVPFPFAYINIAC